MLFGLPDPSFVRPTRLILLAELNQDFPEAQVCVALVLVGLGE